MIKKERRVSPLPRVTDGDRYTATLFDSLDLAVPEGRLEVGTVHFYGQRGETMRPAESTGPERLLLRLNVSWDIEGVTLSVAEPVDDGTTETAFLAHRLTQRLGLAPVTLQVLPLCDDQSFLAGGKYFLFAGAFVRGVAVPFERVGDRALEAGLAGVSAHQPQDACKQD